tara:strand:- start:533 stop:802 length:270 start_codon:yes stop_codon:yes gene_type:complete
MTDSSSNTELAEIAGELMQTKMEMARKDSSMTHVMRIGTFHMELIPDKDIDVREMFMEVLDKLMEKFGDKLLEINMSQIKENGERQQYA